MKSPDMIQYDEIENFYLYNRVTSDQELAFDLSKYPKKLKEFLGEKVNAAVEYLPEEFREVVILSDIENFSYEDISRIAHSPFGAVKSRLYRARRLGGL